MSMSKKDYKLIADGLGRLLAKNSVGALESRTGNVGVANGLVDDAIAIFSDLLGADNPAFRSDFFGSAVREAFGGYFARLRGMIA